MDKGLYRFFGYTGHYIGVLSKNIVATVSSENPNLHDTSSGNGNNERCLTIAERLELASQERYFLDGSSDLSERETRKRIAHNAVSNRHQARWDE